MKPSTHSRLVPRDGHIALRGVFALCSLLATFTGGTSSAQGIDERLWITNAQVYSTALSGNTLYIGGSFTQVGPATGSGVPIDSATGVVLSSFPKVVGTVAAVISDGSGGWYIGGEFTSVGGIARSDIARVLSDLSVSSWNPSATGSVNALALSGGTVYVGGSFSGIGGQARSNLAALNATTGAATAWSPNPDLPVYTLAVSGPIVYAGGVFTTIGGQSRSCIGALNAATGLATAWNPNASHFIPSVTQVSALAVSGATVYVGGTFTTIGGQARNYIAALDNAGGNATTWNPGANNHVLALAVSGSAVYAGGDFTTIGGQSRLFIAGLDAVSNTATSWNPSADNTVNALAVSGSTIYAGGAFAAIGGQQRFDIAALDAGTGAATAWNPRADNAVKAIAVSGSTVYAGGTFASVGGQIRNGIAALDVTTGSVKVPWNTGGPYGGGVYAIAVRGSTVYAGGAFTSIGGQARNYLAALDATSGAVTAWNPNANNTVLTLATAGSKVYAGGDFTSVGGQTRNHGAALHAGSGAVTAWNPNAPNGSIYALKVIGATVYAGGAFTSIGGQGRNHIAALDTVTGVALAWNPNATGSHVQALASSDSVVYAGGNFSFIGGQSRSNVAALRTTTGAATAWNPNCSGSVSVLATNGPTVYIGGGFANVGGQARSRIAAVDATTGAVVAWNPNAGPGTVSSLAIGPSTVYAGGFFTTVSGLYRNSLAAIAAAPAVRSVVPASGGNAGPVTVTVSGGGFPVGNGLSIKLSRSGQPDIPGTAVDVAVDGLSLTATLDLTGKAAGAWDVVVTTLDFQTATLVGGFNIAEVLGPQLRVNVIGPPLIRANRRYPYDVVIENPGNVDALDVPLWLSGVPVDATLELDFPLAYPLREGGEPDWSMVPLAFSSPGGRYVPVVIPRVPPGTTVRRIYLTVPAALTFMLRAAVVPPWADGTVFRDCLANGGISNPACMGAQLTAINAYLGANPTLSALSGIGVWAKIAQCEGSVTLPDALVKAEQVLDFMVGPIESPATALLACGNVLPPRWRDSLSVAIVGAIDPNDKLGIRDTISTLQTIPYSIRFENSAIATAPAQRIVISDPLDLSTLDPNTVSLDVMTFGNVHIVPPPGLRSYTTQVDLRPAKNLLVNVSASVDPFTGVLTWYFTSIDPATGQPPVDPLAGFLPPNVNPPEGEGSVLFTVRPRPNLASGAQIQNSASIQFDQDAPKTTNVWHNTVDDLAPESHVASLGPYSDVPSIPVLWTSEGSPSDLRDFTLYVSEDNAPYRVWRLNVVATNDTLVPPGDHHLHSYAFYSVARDIAGNIEASPVGADATTQFRLDAGNPAPALELALEGARPNPAGGAMTVVLTLANREPTALELIDVAGRRALRRELSALGPGRHTLVLSPAPALMPGLYFLRLIQGSRVLNSRVAVIR